VVDFLPNRAEVSGRDGVRLGLSQGAGQVRDYPAGVDGVADVRQCPAEGGAAAREYVMGSPEPRIADVGLAQLI